MESKTLDTQSDSASPDSESPLAEGMLPPVSPPSPGFIMQLFVIPLIVVSIIVGVWLLVHWAVNRDMRPAELAKDIEVLNHASWQQVLTLANQLRDDNTNQLRGDRELCQKLAAQLQRRVKEGGDRQELVWLRMYLCRALGEFNLPDGLPALAAAAMPPEPKENTTDLEVRRAALQAIIYLRDRLVQTSEWQDPQLLSVAIQAVQASPPEDTGIDELSDSPHRAASMQLRYDRLHSTAAVLLGLIPDDAAIEPLAELLSKDSVDVRYNAAFGLSRHGDLRCEPILVEMLDLDRTLVDEPDAAIKEGKITEDELQQWAQTKREMIILSGLQGASLMSKASRGTKLPALEAAVEEVVSSSSLSEPLRKQALLTASELSAVGASMDERAE